MRLTLSRGRLQPAVRCSIELHSRRSVSGEALKFQPDIG